jgi:hypothetical protein
VRCGEDKVPGKEKRERKEDKLLNRKAPPGPAKAVRPRVAPDSLTGIRLTWVPHPLSSTQSEILTRFSSDCTAGGPSPLVVIDASSLCC